MGTIEQMRAVVFTRETDMNRKPEDWDEIDARVKRSAIEQYALPRFSMSALYGSNAHRALPMDNFAPPDGQRFAVFILERENIEYLVSTEGFNYARYVAIVDSVGTKEAV